MTDIIDVFKKVEVHFSPGENIIVIQSWFIKKI